MLKWGEVARLGSMACIFVQNSKAFLSPNATLDHMPKHVFKFPREVVEAVKQHVRRAIDDLPPERFRQEANYTAALLGRLIGTAYEGPAGKVGFTTTVLDDRGRNAAEHEFGADYAITANISDGAITIEKVILVQAKLGRIEDFQPSRTKALLEQIEKMKAVVPAPKVMEIPEIHGRRVPAMISGNNILAGAPYRPMELSQYFAARITTTLDGCTSPAAIEAVKDSSLTKLRVTARLFTTVA
jgi:hypothetical protein